MLSRLVDIDAGLVWLARIERRPAWVNILVGVGAACAALAVRWALAPLYGSVTGFMILLPAVVLAALAAGRLAGAVAAVACLLGGWAVVGPDVSGVGLRDHLGQVATFNFILVSGFVTLVAASLRKTLGRLDATVAALNASDARIDEAEHRLRLVSEHAPVMLWMSDGTGKCVHLNAEQRAFWKAPDDLAQFDFLGTVHPDDRERLVAATMAAAEDRAPLDIESRSLRHDGEWRILRTQTRPRLGRDGEYLGMIGVNVDVTEARAAEEALRESEARFRLVADNIPNLAWMAEADGAIYWYNQRWHDYTGTTPEQMAGWGWQAVHDPAFVDGVTTRFKQAIDSGRPWEDVFPLRSASGDWRWFLSRAQPVRDADGAIIRWFGTNTDITEQREAEAALRESETRFRLMADTAPSAVWLTNADGEVEFVNQALAAFYGRPEAEIMGHAWLEAVHPDDRPEILVVQSRHREQKEPYGFEARFRRIDGEWRWMRITVNPRFDSAGLFRGYVGLSFDVTESRQAIDALERQQRRQSFLLALTDRLRDLTDAGDIMIEVERSLGAELDADRVGYGEVDLAAGLVSMSRDWTAGVVSAEGQFALSDLGADLIADLADGRFIRIPDVLEDPRTAGAPTIFSRLGTRALVRAPLIRGGQLRAFLYVHNAEPRDWTDDEVALVEEVAARTWTEIERTRAEAVVRESEQRFRAIADTAPVLIWVTNEDRTRAFVNQAYVAFNGGSYEDARDADWRAVLHPDDHERIIRESLAGEATRQPFSMEARYLRHDGEYRWLKSFSRPRLSGDHVIGFVGVAFDVTDIRETNARLAASAAERDAILGQLGEGVIVTDPAGKVVFINEAAKRLHGVDQLDVEPDDYSRTFRLFTEDGRPYPPGELPLARAVLNGETVTEARWRIHRADGVNVLAVGNARPVDGPDGQRIGAVLTLRDETARIQAEHRLTESEARFRTVADSAPALIWMTESDGAVIFTNRRYKTFFSVRRESEVTAGWDRLVHPDDAQPFLESIRAAMGRRDRYEGVVRVNHPTLGLRWLRCEALPRFDAAGAFQGYVGANIDVTEAKKAEDDLKRINELLEERVGEALAEKAKAEADLMHAQRMEAVGRLTGGVAHDFNNLLTVVIGALDIIQRSPKDEAKRQRLAEAALSAARRGERLTHQLLAFSRRQTLRPEPVDLNALIRESEPLLRRAVGDAVEFKLTLRRGGARVNVDPAQFEAALLNLVVNARDAVGDRGRVSVQTALCKVRAGEVHDLPAGDYVCVTVADNGEGIPPEVLNRVFEPFFTTKPIGKGTGLGLSQVYGFTRQSGGGARIRSTPGKGAEIRLYLPPLGAGDALPSADVETGGAKPSMGGRILLVEDDAGVAAIAVDLLSEMGLAVTAVDSGARALEALAKARFDIMLSDIIMPGGMSGVDLAKKAAAEWPGMRIVLASGYAGDDMDETLKDAPWPFLKKPYSADDLRAILGEPA
ncbi:MAG TPA: PAS domain S-box protein [Brevundimonas sp.]